MWEFLNLNGVKGQLDRKGSRKSQKGIMKVNERVPEGWKKVKLNDISKIIKGITYKSSDSENGKYPFFDRSSEVKKSNKYLFDTEAVIVPGEGTDFEPKYYSGKFDLHQRAYALFGLKRIDGKFLYHFMHLAKKELIQHSVGTTVISLRLPHFQSLNVLLPPLPEQRKIAEILETIDNAIEKTDKIIEKYRRIKQGLMQELLTKGIDENGQIRSEETHRFKDSPLGRIPEEWKVVELGRLCILITKGTTPTTYGFNFRSSGIKFLKVESIDEEGNIIENQLAFIDEITHKYLRRSQVKENDLLFSIAGAIGRVFIVNKKILPANINQALALIRLKENVNINTKFLYYFLKSKFIEKHIQKIMVQLAQSNIKLNDVSHFKIPLPPLPEQKRIASILSQIDETIEKEQKYKEKLERIKQGLMEDLLTGKVRVNKLIKYD